MKNVDKYPTRHSLHRLAVLVTYSIARKNRDLFFHITDQLGRLHYNTHCNYYIASFINHDIAANSQL